MRTISGPIQSRIRQPSHSHRHVTRRDTRLLHYGRQGEVASRRTIWRGGTVTATSEHVPLDALRVRFPPAPRRRRERIEFQRSLSLACLLGFPITRVAPLERSEWRASEGPEPPPRSRSTGGVCVVCSAWLLRLGSLRVCVSAWAIGRGLGACATPPAPSGESAPPLGHRTPDRRNSGHGAEHKGRDHNNCHTNSTQRGKQQQPSNAARAAATTDAGPRKHRRPNIKARRRKGSTTEDEESSRALVARPGVALRPV